MSAGELEGLAQSGVEPHRRMVTAEALLALADGASVQPVRTVKALGSHEDTVRRWRNRFAESRVAGWGVAGPGPQAPYPRGPVEAILFDTLHTMSRGWLRGMVYPDAGHPPRGGQD